MLEKVAIPKAETYQEEFLSNLSLVGKKNGGKRPVINLKKLNTFIPYENFKTEGLTCLKFLLEQNNFLRKIEAQVVRQPLRVSLLLFWFRASSKIFYQITKNPNCFFETNKHSNNFLSGRYVADGENLTGNYNSKGYIDFSVAKFRVCHKSEKVNLTFSEAIEISEVTDKYRRNDIVSLRRKTDLFNSTMSGGLLSTQNFGVKFVKVNWPTLVNGPSRITRENSVSFSPIGASIKYSWQLSQTRISLVDTEHKAIQWQNNSTAGTSYDHPNRSFHKGVGSTLQWNASRGNRDTT